MSTKRFTRRFYRGGFTLIELLVVIGMLGIFVTTAIILIDPSGQLAKINDATRTQDLTQIRTALDAYFNDNNCYPQSIPFGSEWQENGVVYMKQVPQDPTCGNNKSNCYIYEVDTSSSCPQWNVVYTKQQRTSQASCSLRSFTNACTPPNFSANYSCVVSGNVACSYITATALPTP